MEKENIGANAELSSHTSGLRDGGMVPLEVSVDAAGCIKCQNKLKTGETTQRKHANNCPQKYRYRGAYMLPTHPADTPSIVKVSLDENVKTIQNFLKDTPILQNDRNVNLEVCNAIGVFVKLLQESGNAAALDTLAYSILEERKSPTDSIIRIMPAISNNIQHKRYIQLPRERSCKIASAGESQNHYDREKANMLHNVLKSITPPDTTYDVICAILTQLASKYEFCVFHENSLKLTVLQVAVLQRLTGMTPNKVEQLKSVLAVICSLLSDLFPGCIRAELMAFELSGALEVKHEQMLLVVTSPSEQRAL